MSRSKRNEKWLPIRCFIPQIASFIRQNFCCRNHWNYFPAYIPGNDFFPFEAWVYSVWYFRHLYSLENTFMDKFKSIRWWHVDFKLKANQIESQFQWTSYILSELSCSKSIIDAHLNTSHCLYDSPKTKQKGQELSEGYSKFQMEWNDKASNKHAWYVTKIQNDMHSLAIISFIILHVNIFLLFYLSRNTIVKVQNSKWFCP